ncbi:MAG TPA: hypothetical protein VF264_02130 [Rhodanobacteraceae bacterium]
MPRTGGLEFELAPRFPEPEVAPDAAAELADLPYVRFSQRPRPPRMPRQLLWLLILVLAAHGGWILYLIFAKPARIAARTQSIISVTLVEPPANAPAPPTPLMPPPLLQAAPPRVHYVAPRKEAISATLESAKGKPLNLYGADGELRLPPPGATAPKAYGAPALQGSQIYSGKSPVPYHPTRFAKDFAPTNQNIVTKTVGRAFDKAVKKTTAEKTVRLPGGIKVHCAVSPLLLFAGCRGDAPQPPPKNDNDIRLSLPPPTTLTGKKVVVPESAASVATPAASGR